MIFKVSDYRIQIGSLRIIRTSNILIILSTQIVAAQGIIASLICDYESLKHILSSTNNFQVNIVVSKL